MQGSITYASCAIGRLRSALGLVSRITQSEDNGTVDVLLHLLQNAVGEETTNTRSTCYM